MAKGFSHKTDRSGITIRRYPNSVRICITFTYDKKLCREYYNLEPTRSNLAWARQQRALITRDIERGAFNYSDWFPNSKKARLFGHAKADMTVGELLDNYMRIARKTLEKSTVRGYDIIIRAQLRPAFGDLKVINLTTYVIRDYVINAMFSKKYMRNILIPLRHVLDQAKLDGIIDKNPLDPIKVGKLMDKAKDKVDKIDPYNSEERQQLINTASGQFKNQVIVSLYTGMRNPCEIFALEWKNIDFENDIIHVRQNLVLGEVKTTKTKAGLRDVTMLPQVRQALLDQKRLTYSGSKQVFRHPGTNKPWSLDKSLTRVWMSLHRKAKVRYRSPKQTRHTYASIMCMAGENLMWIAKQMGHKDFKTFLEYYARFIKDPLAAGGYQFVNDWNKLL